MTKPTAFIGSSGKERQTARLVGRALADTVSVDPWPIALPQGRTIFESLIAKAQTTDFAVFVFVPEDTVQRTDSKPYLSIRDNVLFEFGLFLGELGPDRTFAIMPRGAEGDLPADLRGVLWSTFDPAPSERARSIEVACASIVEAIEALGPRPSRSTVYTDLAAASAAILHSLKKSTERRLAVLAATAGAVIPDVLERKLTGDLHVTIHLANPDSPLKAKLPPHWPDASRNTLRRLAELAASHKPRLTVDCWLYDHAPCVHGFMIDNRELFIGFYRWEDSRLVGAQAPYYYYFRDASTEDYFVLFESWLKSPTAWPEPLPAIA